jgi:hypothetical protein
VRIGIVGARWGRVHVGTFRRFGHEIAVMVGRDPGQIARVAADEGVPLGTVDASALEDVDLVVVAAPTRAHAEYVRAFPHKPVLCEKPLFGLEPPAGAAELAAHPRLYVNYAFPFLEVSSILRARLSELGAVREVRVDVAVDLDPAMLPSHWLAEVAVHPLSLVFDLFGTAPVVAIERARAPGIDVRILIDGMRASATLSGAYRVGGAWRYELDFARERFVEEGRDPWYEANVRCVGAFLEALEGRRRAGVYDGAKALALERAVLQRTDRGDR